MGKIKVFYEYGKKLTEEYGSPLVGGVHKNFLSMHTIEKVVENHFKIYREPYSGVTDAK